MLSLLGWFWSAGRLCRCCCHASCGQSPAQLQCSGTSVIQVAWNPLLFRTGEPFLLAAARLKTLPASQEFCNVICRTCQMKMNLFPCFMLTQRWKWCSHASSSTQDKGRRNSLLSKPGFLSARTDIPGQTTSLHVLPLFHACWGCPEGFFSQPANAPLHLYLALLELVSVGSLEMWPSYEAICTFLFLNEKVKKPPSNEQFVRSELSTSEDESSSQLTLTRFDHVTVGVSKTQKEGTDGHTHTIIHMLKLCVPLLCPFFTCFAWAVEAFSLIALNIVFLSHWVCKIYRACFWQLGIWLLHAQFWTRFWKVPS